MTLGARRPHRPGDGATVLRGGARAEERGRLRAASSSSSRCRCSCCRASSCRCQLAPDWLQTLADLNPVSYAVDAVRAAFNGQWSDPAIVVGSTMTVVIAVVAVWVASRAFSRATS